MAERTAAWVGFHGVGFFTSSLQRRSGLAMPWGRRQRARRHGL